MSNSYNLLIPIVLCVGAAFFIVIVVGAIIFAVVRSGRAMERAWRDLATRLGLTFIPKGSLASPELQGIFRQRPIRLYLYSSGTQGNRQTYTTLTLTVKNRNNGALEITPAGTVWNFLGKIANAQDVEVGSPAFHEHFVVKSNPADFAVRALGEAGLQAGIMGIPGTFRIELDGTSLKYSKAGMEENADFLGKVFGTLSDLADRIEFVGLGRRPRRPDEGQASRRCPTASGLCDLWGPSSAHIHLMLEC